MNLPEPLITVSPEYLGGTPAFTGTRVPVQALFDYIEGGDPLVLDTAAAVLAEVRKAKTEAKQSLRAEVSRVLVRDSPERLAALAAAEADVREAGHIADLVTEEADERSVTVELAS